MIAITKVGDWRRAARGLYRMGHRSQSAMRRAVLQEAQRLRTMAIQGLTNQAPGGKPIAPVSDLTRASRRLRRIYGTKALIVQADLRNSIVVTAGSDRAFVGVLRTARGNDGKSLVDVADVQEFGSDPIVIPITPKMRRFLHRMLREAGTAANHERSGGAQVVINQVPARPFLRPAYALFMRDTAARFRQRLLREVCEESL